jgi:hypothetical protein
MLDADSGFSDTCLSKSPPAGCIVAKREINFLPHTELRMRVDLRYACKGKVCPDDQTCVKGACVPARTVCKTDCDEGHLGCEGAAIASDPKNCGRCGHDCAGGSCVQGQCGTTLVTKNTDPQRFLTQDGPNLYWAVSLGGGVFTCDKTNCAATRRQLVADDIKFFAVDSGNLFWYSTQSSLKACSVADCANTTFGIGISPQEVFWIAARGGRVFWSSSIGLWGCPQMGGLTDTFSTTFVNRMATTANDIFWTAVADNQIERCPLSGCTQPQTFTSASQPAFITVDQNNVCWSASTKLFCCSIGNCPAPTLVHAGTIPNMLPAFEIAVDASDLYWTTWDGHLMRCPATGCNDMPEQLTQTGNYGPLAVDATFVYAGDVGTGDIVRLAK